ncbi:MAG: adenosylmethionine decarboxylase [Gammaproteobacteria bacterium]|jgi:S-adenosylmethionine decarboxylase|nr:adenosylmethionine decarboxylase [Gammaproteobacteria bacterium]MBU0770605.1 adenosylmethionine decarboxylase [Gammaproteobacteria bacterium]MBU0854905.1 adenosylmethionine decarboxylase [Gammaproteobacteria bacterium]MBU1845461.1 adenosylmethionine decarboxylase [Gammaproteobacteria bacterium]
MNATGSALGSHVLLDLHGVAPPLLCDAAALERVLRDAAEAAGACVLSAHFHGFGAGMGVTGVLLLAESHISIHTWPERSYAAVDVFMCGGTQPMVAVRLIQERLLAPRSTVRECERG